MDSWPSWVLTLLGALAGGAGVYAAIRSDLADLKARMINQETHSAEMRSGMRYVHERIDKVHSRFGDL